MIWATVSSRSCFCWLYKASPSLAAENIISLILVLTIWWCPCVESSVVLLKEGICYDQCVLLGKLLISLCPASFCIPRPNLPVTPGVYWLPTFAFQSPIMKRTSFGVLIPKGFVGLHRTVQLQFLQHYWLGHRPGLLWYWMVCLGNGDHSVILEIAPKYCILDSFLDSEGYSISFKGFLLTVVDIKVIWIKFAHSSPFYFADS